MSERCFNVTGLPTNRSSSHGPVPLPGARRALLLLLMLNLFNYLDRYVLAAAVPDIHHTFFPSPNNPLASGGEGDTIGSFLPWFQHIFGFTPENALIGLLSTAFMVVYMSAAPLCAKLAERLSRWGLIGVAVIVWSLASGGSGMATTFGTLVVTRCLVGIGEAAYGPIAPAIISDLYPSSIRARVLTWFYLAIPVGSALGYMLGSQVARSPLGWRWAFYLVVMPGICLGTWVLLMPDPTRGQADAADVTPPRRVTWRDTWVLVQTPSYVLNTLGMTAMTFAMGGIAFWMPDYVQGYRKASTSATTIFGLITVTSGLAATLLGTVAGDALRSRFSGAYFLVSGVAILVGFPVFLLALFMPFPWAWLLIFLACFCLFANTGLTNTILANVTPPALRPSAFALNIFVIHAFGDAISPLVIGLLVDRYDMNVAFLLVGLMFPVAGGVWLAGAPYLKRDTALASACLQCNA